MSPPIFCGVPPSLQKNSLHDPPGLFASQPAPTLARRDERQPRIERTGFFPLAQVVAKKYSRPIIDRDR